MKLRDHPLMSYGGIRSWPPLWTQNTFSGTRTLKGELGLLEHVLYCCGDQCSKVFLVIEHENRRYVGTLLFSDGRFCEIIAWLLRLKVGQSIKDIGDSDLTCAIVGDMDRKRVNPLASDGRPARARQGLR